ncbi:hypothetical protein [Brachybacterium sp. YJGR34]|uniref:hypothetical protein n=1 Tax=Brachybacterium sp. YJGR34 TaxID=2059911 RepID=UPI0013009154|nr:hypothetical protein [Brachybacterium sp. YJGR34]
MSRHTVIALGAVATTVLLAIAPLTGMHAWGSTALGVFLLIEIAALWAMGRDQA